MSSTRLRHVAMFRWNAETTAADVEAVAAGLRALPGKIPEIRRYEFGPDLGINETSWHFVVVAEFDGREGFVAYRDHPAHQALIAAHITPHAEARASVQVALG